MTHSFHSAVRHATPAGLAFVSLLFLTAPTALAGGGDCASSAEVCLLQMAEKLRDRGWVGINLDVQEDGMRIKGVVPDSPAERADLRVGDKIVALEGVAYAEENREKLQRVYEQMMKPGKTIRYTVIRGDESLEIPILLGRLPEELLAQWVGEHMLAAHAPATASHADGG